MPTEEQKKKIENLTGFTLDEIYQMSNSQFVLTLGRLKLKGRINQKQYVWLDVYRQRHGKPSQLLDVLDVFQGSKEIL